MKKEKLRIDRTEGGGKGRGRDEKVGKKPRVEVGVGTIVLVGTKKKTQVGLVGM